MFCKKKKMTSGLELQIFIPFFVTGLVSFFLIPPIKKEEFVCGCKLYTNCGWKSLICDFFMFGCLTFCFFFLLLDTVIHFYLTVVESSFSEAEVYGLCLLVAAALALLAVIFGGQTIWAIAAWAVIVSLLLNVIIECGESKSCFLLRAVVSLIVSAFLSAGISAFAYRLVGDLIYNIQASFASSFTIVMSLLVIVMGFDEWDAYTVGLPYGLILFLSIVRSILVWMYGTLICCIDEKYRLVRNESE